MTSQFTNNSYDVEEVGDQAQLKRRDQILNQLSEQGHTTNFLERTGIQVKSMAQGATDVGKGAAQGAVNLARGAANIAQGAADAVKNTLGITSPGSTNKDVNLPFKTAADAYGSGAANNMGGATYPTTANIPNNPNDSRV